MHKPNRKNDDVKVHKASKFVLFLGALMLIVPYFVAGTMIDAILFPKKPVHIITIIFAFIWIYGALEWTNMLYLHANSHNIFTPDDMVFNSMGWSGKTRWDNMKNFGYRKIGRNKHFGIELHTPMRLQKSRFSMGKMDETFLSISNGIPTKGLFDRTSDYDKFAQTDFGRDLLHYAPHLFEGKLTEKAKVG